MIEFTQNTDLWTIQSLERSSVQTFGTCNPWNVRLRRSLERSVEFADLWTSQSLERSIAQISGTFY
jgi:hypothetical protein